MEVHAHTHHGKKKWTEYLWEFLMLFLAVFCGFMAEYFLEHKIEKEKGNQYVRLYYEDLKTDTTNFSNLILGYKDKLSHLENRYKCFDSVTLKRSGSDCLAGLIEYSSNFTDLVYTDRTIQQLKNAGGIRLLNEADADSILFYDNMLRRYKASETTSFQESQTGIRNTLYLLVNFKSRKEFAETNQIPNVGQLLNPGKQDLLNLYFNQLETYVSYCMENYKDITDLKLKAASLIVYFKNKYHLQ